MAKSWPRVNFDSYNAFAPRTERVGGPRKHFIDDLGHWPRNNSYWKILLSLYSKFIKFWRFWRFLLPLYWPNLGQYHFSCLYMAKNWMNTCFYPRKKILECKHLNLANLRSNERPFVEINKICSENGILSWSQKLENEDLLCFFGQNNIINVGQDGFLMLANVEKLSEMIFGCFLISRTMSGTCFGQDLAKKPWISS